MRDLDSIAITLTLAETGHLVFGTLHTNDARRRSTASSTCSPRTSATRSRSSSLRRCRASSASDCSPPSAAGRVAAYEVLLANDASATSCARARAARSAT
jgi:twitching motility protein PilT